MAKRAHGDDGFLARLSDGLSSSVGYLNASILYMKGAPAFGLLAAALFTYFQYLSNYESKVRDVSKDDLASATTVFIEISNKLASAMTLQQMLYFNFIETRGKKPEEISLPMQTAPDLYKTYSTARTELRQNIAVYARRAEIFIDWPSDLDRDPAQEKTLPMDPISKSGIAQKADTQGGVDIINLIGAYNFDCDQMFPVSRKLSYLGELTLPRPKGLPAGLPDQIVINWSSLKHQLVTLQYCFERIHDALRPAREWAASVGTTHPAAANYKNGDGIHDKLDDQVARFNFFVALAMRRIEDIRIKYRPNGFWCYVPGVREIADELKRHKLIDRGCGQIHYANSDGLAS